MAGSEGGVDAGAPNLNLTPEEKRVYGQLFRQADTDNVGVVTGEVAVKFFEKTRLDSKVLGEIWQIADRENRGFLTPAGFGIVLRLIGHAQAGREPTAELALQPAPLPRFDGFVIAPQPTGSPAPPAPLQSQGTGGVPVRIPPLTPDKVTQYTGLFERQTLQAGNLLPGDKAKQIFEKSGLQNEVLGRIWQLADTEQRGALVLTEFVIAMHLLTSMKSGALRGLPTVLPAALYEAATRRGSAAPPAGPFPRQQSPTTVAPLSAIPRQLSGQAGIVVMRTGSPLGRSPLAPQATGDWLITAPDKVRFDQLYDELDKTKKGFITGEEAVPFFSQSNLSEDVLAQIWDLADIRSEGKLNKDEFAVAMYLIRQQRSKKDGPSPLPATLPLNLVPPNMRGLARPTPAATAFEQSPPLVVNQSLQVSALDDLLGMDSSPPPAPVQSAVGTGGSNDPFASSASPAAPSSPIRPTATGTAFKPFVPSSSFGRTLTSQTTGDSNASSPSFPKLAPQPTASDDLLGDHDAEASKKISSDTVELGNLSNQISSLSKQMQDVQGQRSNIQNELNQASMQKKKFEQRLSQLRALYEKEVQDVRALEQQLTASRNDTRKIQTELAMLDGTHQDLQNQHRQVLTALQADQQENANLKERIRIVNAEVAQLKPQIEKLKSEARQQKGLVAINKKQLATNEGEREKLKLEVDDLTKSNAELARQVEASSQSQSPAPVQVTSPALSTTSANNPFFRRTGSTDIAATFSPPIKPFNDKSFDDVFGPSFPTSNTPPPATSFKPQHTGTSTGSVGSYATPATSTPNASRQPTAAAEPPPPPESRQLSSSFLPFVDAPESLSSSRQVSPPASRLGNIDSITGEPQSSLVTSPIEATKTGQSLASASESETSKKDIVASPTEIRPTSNGSASLPGAIGDESSKGLGASPPPAKESDPFAAMDQAKAKVDFDSAFASFKKVQGKAPDSSEADVANAFTTFNSDFPPISELERDDDTESESDKAGFDDDFAPASPPNKAPEKQESKPSSPTAIKAPPGDVFANAEDSVSSAATEKPAVNDKTTLAAPTANNISTSSLDDIFGSSSSAAPAPATSAPSSQSLPAPAPGPASASSKGAFDDLDDDFEGLEDAREGSADDDFATISRSGLDDFNPVFDSSPPRSQVAKSESTNTNAGFGVDSSFDFGTLSTTSAAGSTIAANHATAGGPGSAAGAAAQPKGATQPENHDWDAIFASLDDSPAASTSPPPSAAPAAAASPKGKAETTARPTPGRALTEEGLHDDPILKNLTSMGYSRADALLALEKYDYNLERAANHLASQS